MNPTDLGNLPLLPMPEPENRCPNAPACEALMNEANIAAANLREARELIELIEANHAAEVTRLNERTENVRQLAARANENYRRAEQRLKLVAGAVVPILKRFVLMSVAYPEPDENGTLREQKQTAADLVKLLEPLM